VPRVALFPNKKRRNGIWWWVISIKFSSLFRGETYLLMARAEIGTAKYQAKKLKASGLQQLKYYCQLCHKQCRDANGYKNHLLSPSHKGRVEDMEQKGTKKVTEDFSRQFLNAFMTLLRISHGNKSVDANKFYQEYISNDRDHVHMNSTKWSSLTLFVQYLGKNSYVRVEQPGDDENDHSLMISYIDHSDQKSVLVKRQQLMKNDEEQSMRFLSQQIEAGRNEKHIHKENDSVHEVKEIPKEGIKVQLRPKMSEKKKTAAAFNSEESEDSEDEAKQKKTNIGQISKKLLGR
jgi:DNA/RNA-binding protein KIN17